MMKTKRFHSASGHSDLRMEVEEKDSNKWSLGSLLAVWVVFALDCCSLRSFSISGVFYIFSHYHFVSLIVLANTQMTSTAGQIGAGFRSLTTALEASRDLHWLVQWHQRLTSSCRFLSRVYSVELLILFASSLVSCIAGAYLTVQILHTGKVVHIIVCLFWTVILCSVCFKIISAFVNVRNRALEFDASLYKLIVNNNVCDFSFYGPSYRLYFHFCRKSNVSFSAFGFFEIDWQLATTMVAAVFTYVVLLVQFTGQNNKI